MHIWVPEFVVFCMARPRDVGFSTELMIEKHLWDGPGIEASMLTTKRISHTLDSV